MALVKCKECGNQISSEAKTCPQCGAKPEKKTSVLKWLIFGVIGYFAYSTFARFEDLKAAATEKPASLASPATTATPEITHDPQTSWVVNSENDQMTGKPTKFAFIVSSNTLSLASPYSGENHGDITIRKRAGKPEDVLFSIKKGQSMCRSYKADCRVVVRFDENPPINFSGQTPSDGSSNVIFLSPAQKFIAESKKSKRIKVSLDIYSNGVQIVEFNPGNALAW